ncbi:uncharacterized protein LOC122370295 [Amphibalanus amphitrite]|uniref:uncharacterized protein LOC122370295 n=1 Tax=Amphibalanus amphitrite TaxID=1232801 RepID=UPI001C916CDF|nr:uncharacterized protein LOC122370295 [Amphibalanus amphitrite]
MEEKRLQRADLPERPLPEEPGRRRRRLRANSLWSCWYGIFTCCVHVALACRALQAYRAYLQLPWQSPPPELAAYVGMVAVSLSVAPLFLLASCLRVGNRANDGARFGSPRVREAALPSPRPGALKNMWRHGPPTAPLLHVLMAGLLCCAEVIMEARLIGNGFLPPDLVWRSDLDAFLDLQTRVLPLQFGAERANMTVVATAPPPALVLDPVSGFVRQPATLLVSPQTLHLAGALLVLAIRYAAVFWDTQRALAAVFSVQLLLSGAHLLLSLCGFSVLYKIHVYGGAELLRLPDPLLLNAPLTALLFGLSSVLVLISGATVYLYGFQKLAAFVATYRRELPELAESRCRLWGYFSHSAALCLLLAVGVADGPLLYELSAVYRASLDPACLVAVIGAIAHHFLWVLLWLALTLRHRWQFKLKVEAARVAVPDAPHVHLVHEVALRRERGEATPLLVVGNSGAFSVTEPMAQNLILGVATRKCGPSKAVPMAPLHAASGRQTAAARRQAREAEEEEEERYVQLPRHPQQRRSRVTFEREGSFRRCGGYQAVPTEDGRERSPMYHQPEDGEYASLYKSQQQLRRAAACDGHGASRQPLLPHRYAIRPPPESVYMARAELPPPPVRRANSFEALPRAADGPQRSFSFRNRSAGGRRIANTEPKVAFDLRTTVIGESPPPPRAQMPSANSAFSPPEPTIAETALNHLPPPPPSMLPPPPSPLRLYEDAERINALGDMPRMRSPRSIGVINQLNTSGSKRDSANFSMSVSSGSDSGST